MSYMQWTQSPLLIKIRLFASLALMFFAATHFLNHALGLISLETMEEGREDKIVARLLAEAVKSVFERHARVMDLDELVAAFDGGTTVDVGEAMASSAYVEIANRVTGLKAALAMIVPGANAALQASATEFIFEGLHLNKKLNKNQLHGQARYRG